MGLKVVSICEMLETTVRNPWLDRAAEGNMRNSLNLQHRRFRVVSIKSQLLHS